METKRETLRVLRNSWLAPVVLALAMASAAPAGSAHAASEADGLIVVSPLADGGQWFLREQLTWRANSGKRVCVPENFVTDFASVPRFFWALMPVRDGYGPAAVVHDYLYWAQSGTREEADRFMLEAMRDQGVGWFRRSVVYGGVRTFGWLAWSRNIRSRSEGHRRVIPKRMVPSHAAVTWTELSDRIRGTDAPEQCAPPPRQRMAAGAG